VEQPILVVEDDESIASAIVEVLSEEGYSVITAANGREALERVARHPPSLILLDMKMPVMDGWAFASTYRAQPGTHAPLIVLTAARDAGERAAEIQAQAFLAKPFAIEHLLDLVQRFLP
jgi:two-component system, chemotaxis family, chemotaxis protein CheY